MPRAAWELLLAINPHVALAANGRTRDASPILPAVEPMLEVRELEPAKAIMLRVQQHTAGAELPPRAA